MGTNKKTFGTRTNLAAQVMPLGCEIGISFNYFNSSLQSLIPNKAMQLIETPSAQPEVEPFSLLLFSYAFKVFQNDSSSVAIANNLFADYMVPVSLETPLPARNLLQEFLAGTSAFALEPCSQSLEFEPVRFNFATAKELPIACYSNMVYSDINTKKSVRISWNADVSGKCNMQEHSVVLVNSKQSSLITPIKILPIVFRNFNRNVNPTIDCCESDFIKTKSKCSLIKSKGHTFLKSWLRTLVSLDRFKSLRSYSIGVYDKLRGQVKAFSGIIIAEMVKLVSVIDIGLKSLISYVLDSFRVLLHSLKQKIIFRNFQLNGCNGFHGNLKDKLPYMPYGQMSSPVQNGGWQFLPRLKSWVSLPYGL